MKELCYCGADDCPRCRPYLFTRDEDGKYIYNGEDEGYEADWEAEGHYWEEK